MINKFYLGNRKNLHFTFAVIAIFSVNLLFFQNCSPMSAGSSSNNLAAGVSSSSNAISKPGPSPALFANPYYKCLQNFYVSNSGNDSNNGTSPNTAWSTLQHADSMNLGAGACVNVAAGTYDGIEINNGTAGPATSTGYLVYRCQTLDGCTINGNAGVNGNASVSFNHANASSSSANMPNFVMFDGFNMVGKPLANQGPYGVGFNVWNGTNGTEIASHHIWLLNSVVHGFSQAGIAFAASEYLYAIHNTSYGNANTTCDAQGSGLGLNIAHTVPNYTPSSDDLTNPNPLLGPTWQRSDGQFFHNVFEYNVTYNNALTQCGSVTNPYDTDGNGIIFDTLAGNPGGNPGGDYPSPSLAAFNVSYNNGGGGVHIYISAHITVANNTTFNNYIDPANQGGGGMIDDNEGYDNTFINNLSEANPGAIPPGGCHYYTVPYNMYNSAILLSPKTGMDTATNNITNMLSPGCYGEIALFNGQTYSNSTNKEATNPMWVDVGSTSLGTESTPPIGSNFALQTGSPAIGAGLREPYLSSQSVDVGACSSTLTSCP